MKALVEFGGWVMTDVLWILIYAAVFYFMFT